MEINLIIFLKYLSGWFLSMWEADNCIIKFFTFIVIVNFFFQHSPIFFVRSIVDKLSFYVFERYLVVLVSYNKYKEFT